MKQKLIYAFFSALLLAFFSNINAQNYLDVPPDPNFSPDYLNNVIYGDTTDNGERYPDRVYRLQVGGIYYFNNPIVTDGWDLKIVAEGDPIGGFDKAIILVEKNDQGKVPARFAEVHGDLLFKNLYFSCVTTKNKQVNDLTRVYKDGAKIEMDNCYVEWTKLFAFARIFSQNTSVRITDSYFNNVSGVGGPFNGKVIQFQDNPVKEIFVQNNTFVNIQGPLINIRFNTVRSFVFDHNTVVNEIKWPFHHEYWVNGKVTNNIFFNTSSYGENTKDASNQDQEGLQFGIINFFDVPDSILAQVGMNSQNERKMDVHNNLFYYDQDVKDYIAKWWASDSVKEEPWMNSRTKALFDDDANYPYLDNEDPITEDAGFIDYPTADSMIHKMDQWRTDGKKTTWFWVDVDSDKVSNPSPRPWDLSYPTTSVAYTAADGGYPLGDLNWFPDKKADWLTAVNDGELNVTPKKFELSQNYPNPFNPSTLITYNLPAKSMVTLSVFNVIGQKIATLVNGVKNAGVHKVTFNAKNLPSGVYIYKLSAGAFTASKKMILIK